MRRLNKNSPAWDHIDLMPGAETTQSNHYSGELSKEQILRFFGCPTCQVYAGQPCLTTEDDYRKLINGKTSWWETSAQQYGTSIGGVRPMFHLERWMQAQ